MGDAGLRGRRATPIEVLRAATIGSAEVIGHSDDVGSLEPGKFADLLILDATRWLTSPPA